MFQKPNFFNESMTLKWNFQRGGGFNFKNLPWGGGGYGYFLEQHIHERYNYERTLKLSRSNNNCLQYCKIT